MRVSEAAQNAALAFEPLLSAVPDEGYVERLHGDAPVESAVVAFRQPDAAHAPLTDLRYQGVQPEILTGQAARSRKLGGMRFEEALVGKHAVFPQQNFQLLRQSCVLSAQRSQPEGAFFAA